MYVSQLEQKLIEKNTKKITNNIIPKIDNKSIVKNNARARARAKKQNEHKKELLICPYCSQKISRGWMKPHIRLHTKEKLFKCSECDKSFPYQYYLKLHMFVHLNNNVSSKTSQQQPSQLLNNINTKKLLQHKHECNICKKYFSRPSNLTKHKQTHILKPYSCKNCKKSFPDEKNFKIHIKSSSAQPGCKRIISTYTYVCEYCDKTFTNPSELVDHTKLHEPDVSTSQDVQFLSSVDVELHKYTTTNENKDKCVQPTQTTTTTLNKIKVPCPFCRRLMDKSYLPVHMRIHTGDKPFTCSNCNKGFSDICNFKKHFERCVQKPIINKNKNYKKKVQYDEDDDGKLDSSNKSHETTTGSSTKSFDYSCNVCNKAIESMRGLTVHGIKAHGSTCYPCGYCDLILTQHCELIEHILIHHKEIDEQMKSRMIVDGKHDILLLQTKQNDGEKLSTKTTSLVRGKKQNIYTCGFCGKIYKNISNFQVHVQLHADSEKFKCTQCSKTFPTIKRLEKHGKFHTKDNILSKCNICGKIFKKENLKRHLKIHTAVKTFECDSCNMRFLNKCSLELHRRVHTGEKLFTCGYCGVGFSQHGGLIYHEARGCQKILGHGPTTKTKSKSKIQQQSMVMCAQHVIKKALAASRTNSELFAHARINPRHWKLRTKPRHSTTTTLNLKKMLEPNTVIPFIVKDEKPNIDEIQSLVVIDPLKIGKHEKKQKGYVKRLTTIKTSFRCHCCKKIFKTMKGMKSHERIHVVNQTLQLQCQICGEKFRNKNTLSYHRRSHAEGKKFECLYCKKKFRCSTNLKKHIRIHTGEKPFTCSLCGVSFSQINGLRYHEIVHRRQEKIKTMLDTEDTMIKHVLIPGRQASSFISPGKDSETVPIPVLKDVENLFHSNLLNGTCTQLSGYTTIVTDNFMMATDAQDSTTVVVEEKASVGGDVIQCILKDEIISECIDEEELVDPLSN